MSGMNPTRINCVCALCSKVFTATASDVARGGGKYCSQKCYHAISDHRPNVMVPRSCEKCGKSFLVWPVRLRKGGGRFCTLACRGAGLALSAADHFGLHVGPATATGCLPWTGEILRNGYGRIERRTERRRVLAHRFAWELTNGPISDSLAVLHRCDHRACVNVEHLFLGTHADNMADMTTKGRQARGESAGRAKLTAIAVRAIREQCRSGRKHRLVAQEFGVSVPAIEAIIYGKTWKHIQ